MIVDAFTFFNEKELVELRIKYLSDIVDYFFEGSKIQVEFFFYRRIFPKSPRLWEARSPRLVNRFQFFWYL